MKSSVSLDTLYTHTRIVLEEARKASFVWLANKYIKLKSYE